MMTLALTAAAFICGVPAGIVIGIILGYRVARPAPRDDDWPVGGWGV
jgi:hypothetical protein